MSLVEKVTSFFTSGERASEPVGTIHVVDPSPLNWLYITYNTGEEFVRVNTDGAVEPAAMKSYSWADDRTLEIEVREGEVFPDGEPLTATAVKQSFDEMVRWRAPPSRGRCRPASPRRRTGG